MRRRIIIWLNPCVWCLFAVCTGGQAQDDINKLMRVVDSNARGLSAAEVRYKMRWIPSPAAGMQLQDVSPQLAPFLSGVLGQQREAEIRLLYDGSRFRSEYTEITRDRSGNIVASRHEYGGFDGRMGWLLSPESREGSLLATPGLLVDPRIPFMVPYWNGIWSAKLAEAREAGRIRSIDFPASANYGEGEIMVVLARDDERTEKLYFAPKWSYMLRKQETFFRGRLSSIDEVTSAVEVSPGVWFPMRSVHILCDDSGREIVREVREVISVEKRSHIPISQFAPNFPTGTRVSDMVNNRVYVVTSPLWTFRRTLIALVVIALLTAFWWWRYRLRTQSIGT